jgi:hypothetical protein
LKKASGVTSKEPEDFPCTSIFPEISRPGRSVLVNPNEGERQLVAEEYVVVGAQCELQHVQGNLKLQSNLVNTLQMHVIPLTEPI